MLWLGVAYLGALAALFITALWTADGFTGNIERTWTLENFRDVFQLEVYRTITVRTLLTAVGVTLVDAIIAFPVALYMAKVASPRAQRLLVIAVLTPLWASYLVKAPCVSCAMWRRPRKTMGCQSASRLSTDCDHFADASRNTDSPRLLSGSGLWQTPVKPCCLSTVKLFVGLSATRLSKSALFSPPGPHDAALVVLCLKRAGGNRKATPWVLS
jgi:hypothetical protein